MDELINELNEITVKTTIDLLPSLNNKQLQQLINALVTESKKRNEKKDKTKRN